MYRISITIDGKDEKEALALLEEANKYIVEQKVTDVSMHPHVGPRIPYLSISCYHLKDA